MNNKHFIEFMKKSTSCFQATAEIEKILTENGFTDIDTTKIELGGKYYKKRDDSAIIAFIVPSSTPEKLLVVSSHCDSPCYKIKTNPHLYKNDMTYLNVSPYGGMIHSSFMDIPLSISGRVCYLKDNIVQTKLIDFKTPVCIMANLAIHYNREINKGYVLTPGKDLIPFLSNEKIDLLELLKTNFNIDGDILSHDLFVYSAVNPYIWGVDNEFVTSPRLDDLQCAYASTKALTLAKPTQLAISCVFNNEEIGSMTYGGAMSDFLNTVLAKIQADLGIKNLYDMLEQSFAISADNAHGFNANYSEYYDSTNRAFLNKGIVIKFNANQKYTTTAVTAAKFMKHCNDCSVPYQVLENHSNIAGGSTLGNILNSQLSLPSVDIGLAQYSMHSAVETAGILDTKYLIDALTSHFNGE